MGGITYIIKNASNQTQALNDFTVDIDQVIHDFLRRGGKRVKNTVGFIVLGVVSLYRIIAIRVAKFNFIQRILEKIQL